MWIPKRLWEHLQKQLEELKVENSKYREANSQLVERLLVKNEVPPVVIPDNRRPAAKLEEIAQGMDDFFAEIPQAEYDRLDREALVAREREKHGAAR